MRNTFIKVEYPNPHLVRRKEILDSHPEVRGLFGPFPATAVYTFILVGLQLGIAAYLDRGPWWFMVLIALTVGATVNHALFVIVHEATHNLVFKWPLANRIIGLVANFPQFFPSSMPFFKYHMLHHTHQSLYDYDADIASPTEAEWVNNSRWKKGFMLFFFSFVQGVVRPSRLKEVKFWDPWSVVNIITEVGFLIGFYFLTGWGAIFYFLISTLFALGLHPLGGRWIQEHYVVKENQETNSYYGPLNKLCFNMGYHNEHHDFMNIPWSRLPMVRAMAPEFYNPLFFYRSWSWCLWRFIFDPKVSLFDRVVRGAPASMAPNKT